MLKVCMSAIVWSFVCIGNFVVVVSGEQDTQNQKIARLAKAGAPEELAKCISAVLPRIPKGDLDSLVGNEDCTVALAAGWERVRRTVPNEEQRIPIPPQSQSISQFIGLLEGSTRVSIPHFWKDL